MTTPRLSGGSHRGKSRQISTIKLLIPVFVIIMIAVAGLVVLKTQLPQKPHVAGSAEVEVGATLPEFKLQKFAGGTASISAIKGKVYLMNFWATWCEACMVEMPSIVKLRNKYGNRGLEVLLVDVDEHPQSAAPPILRKFGIDFPIYVDSDGQLTDLFDVRAIPFTIVMDKNRNVLMVESGERDWNGSDFAEQLDRWLAQ